jgi:alkanesulfonate monooxygenase SsuD/methylene tetrahydromethanopterin reductase-like flavin-dependent oxidoreductase (luciferase family)
MRVSWLLMGKPLPALEAEAAACDEAGLDGVWWADYQGPADPDSPYPELGVTLGLLARITRRCAVGSLVTDVVRRHPMVVAHLFATLSHLAPGRVILGLGAGGGTSHAPFGISLEAPARTLAEGIEVIRLLWRATPQAPATFQGRRFQLSHAALPILPDAPVPIYVAAQGPRMLRVAGRLGDGWMPEAHTPETYRQMRAAVEAARPSDGRPFEWGLALLFFPFDPEPPDRRRLVHAARTMLAFNVGVARLLHPQAVPAGVRSTDLAGRPDLWRRIGEALPDEVVEQTILWGSPERCAARLAEYARAGCTHVALEPYWGMSADDLLSAIAAAGRIIQVVASL